MDLRLKVPFSMSICASRDSGKTYFVKELLKHQNKLLNLNFSHVYWVSKFFHNDLFAELKSIPGVTIEFILKEIPKFETYNKQTENTLICIDDFLCEASKLSTVQHLFLYGRHQNFSVCFISQNIYHQTNIFREIKNNTDYFVLFSNRRNRKQIMSLATQLYPDNPKFFYAAHQDATAENFGHLLTDCKTNTVELLCVRSKIFSNTPIVYVPKQIQSNTNQFTTRKRKRNQYNKSAKKRIITRAF